MQKQAWVYTMMTTLLGAVSLLLRWLQTEGIYDENGLPTPGSARSWVVAILLVLIPVVLWWYSGRLDTSRSSEEPSEALACPNNMIRLLHFGAAAICLLGSLVMLLSADDAFMRIVALIGLLTVAAVAAYTFLPQWEGFGAGISVLPVIFFSLWLISFYKTNAKDPVLWHYCVAILAIAGCLFGSFRLAGYLFYRIKPRATVFACALAQAYSMTVIMDDIAGSYRVIFAGWALFFGVMVWLLVNNFTARENREEEEPASAARTETKPSAR